jgi:hypothetical protein
MKDLIVGFTGTREDLLPEQHHALLEWTKSHADDIVGWHHGCCIGADAESVEILRCTGGCNGIWIVGHPPTKREWLSNCAWHDSDETLPSKPYLTRNRDIVAACNILVACPKDLDSRTGGTWYTIRHAYATTAVPIVVIEPNGTIHEDFRDEVWRST